MQAYLLYGVVGVFGLIVGAVVTYFVLKNNPQLLVKSIQSAKANLESRLSKIDAQLKAGVYAVMGQLETSVGKAASNVAAAYVPKPTAPAPPAPDALAPPAPPQIPGPVVS
jgi:hypothetical protein